MYGYAVAIPPKEAFCDWPSALLQRCGALRLNFTGTSTLILQA